jgi:hypothetical protein
MGLGNGLPFLAKAVQVELNGFLHIPLGFVPSPAGGSAAG